MDEFKRVYSNEEETKSIAWFWEQFDPENYSIWFGEYKYNNELQKVFMSCNLISGKLVNVYYIYSLNPFYDLIFNEYNSVFIINIM